MSCKAAAGATLGISASTATPTAGYPKVLISGTGNFAMATSRAPVRPSHV
eukprot:CAMPEP_0197057846 /NCGR_PEP_ID=MMETSP1384-20130603/101538_1 /TAXON_ID=29189 /ORGANISM="Ammonia sp." /LENGTH=49 /DNA_ID= /DNA_START= /DNA_END= /DNA_ORIENTATION=